jgi:starch-binding outer membrane protein, SusD/RagB family
MNTIKIFSIILISGSLALSCKKQLEIPSRNSLDASVALTTPEGIEASLNSVYSVLKGEVQYGRDMFSIPDAMADIAFANGRSSRLLNENRNQALSNVANWGSSYNAINEINLTLAAVPNIGTATQKARWEGEFRFLRALYYFDLVKNYAYIPTFVVASQDMGGVVLNLQGFNSGTAAAGYLPSRATTSQVYTQIMNDLYASISLLTASNRGVNYASRHAALALGSRVQLYAGNWQRADSFATAAITLTGGIGTLSTTANYVSGWRAANHPEGIFQVFYATVAENIGVNTSLAATHTTLSAPGAFSGTRQGQGDLVPNAFLLTQLGITGFPNNLASSTPITLTYGNDIRARLFESGVNAAGHYVECTKWMGKNGAANWDNTVVLRWTELYLNRAEARYRSGNEAGANADLNVIRTARITGFTPGAPLAGQALLDEILRQRMLEFAFEGQRFYDLKRYGLDISKSNPSVSMPATDYRILPRIPVTEVDGNPNMKQNFGY